jgi:hypothetical protein
MIIHPLLTWVTPINACVCERNGRDPISEATAKPQTPIETLYKSCLHRKQCYCDIKKGLGEDQRKTKTTIAHWADLLSVGKVPATPIPKLKRVTRVTQGTSILRRPAIYG